MNGKSLAVGAVLGASGVAALLTFRKTRPKHDAANMREAGATKGLKTTALEAGARVLQPMTPLSQFDIYMVGFHPMKSDPGYQMEAHHFCRQVNEDLTQCILFSGNTSDAHVNGLEYIISEKLYETLDEEERQYWHPHNYEILSGTLVAPGLPDFAEHEFMKHKINSYGKTWHTWKTGSVDQPGDALPLGPALLAWSFNHDDEMRGCILSNMEKTYGIDSNQKRRDRKDLAAYAHPQGGVNAIRQAFPNATKEMDGVVDKEDAPLGSMANPA